MNFELPLMQRRLSITWNRSSKERRPNSLRRRSLITKAATGRRLGKWAFFERQDIFAIDSYSGP